MGGVRGVTDLKHCQATRAEYVLGGVGGITPEGGKLSLQLES